jgi:Tol biopolymer transport system component
MALPPGTRIGPYEIVSALGAGGMGEVYRARDTTLGRDVAIKLLPASVAADPDRVARFAREARLLAALNHRHIATIHGFEDSGGAGALVMELVEGPTLDEKIAQDDWRHAKPAARLSQTLAIARQIAEGLEAAHGQGIIHRDLKPANIKLSRDGTVKVLDFGLAKALSSDAAPSAGPTITGTALPAGTIVGTPAYMSPEQARGLALDKRTDIWAFGCVLYELLTGRMAFPGKTISDTIAAILERDPDWSALPPQTPAGLRRLARRCLEKDPDRRLHDIADARLEIEDAASPASADASIAPARGRNRTWIAWTTVMAVAALGAGAAAIVALRPPPAVPEARLEINTAPTRDASIAISPDGLSILYVIRAVGPQLWLRALDSPAPRLLPGTEHATTPFWSPDGRSIGFYADGMLKRMDLEGGSPQTLSLRSAVPLGGAWSRHGTILFADSPGGPVLRVAASGGSPTPATKVDTPRQRGHLGPLFLPDGRHFLFFVNGSAEASGVYVGELDSFDTTRLFEADGPAEYAESGHLLFPRNGKIYAQRFDADRRVVSGEPFVVADTGGRPTLSVSATGTIAYRLAPPDSGQRQLIWLDRDGRELDKVVYAETAAQGPALSHDGRRLAIYRFVDRNMDIWTYDIRRRTWDRITSEPGDDIYPLWSPDDASMIYGAVRKTDRVNLYRRLLNAPPASEEALLESPNGSFPMDWSADGRFVLYNTFGKGNDLWALPLDGDRKPFEVAATDFNDSLGQFSPDGHWVAYQSDRTGRSEIYVRPFPGPGSDTRVSTDGGAQVRWNPSGKELFYVAEDDRLMAVPVSLSADRKGFEPGTPAALFVTNIGSTAVLKYRQQYVVSHDGQSFVMQSVVGGASASPISVILNWKPKG